MPIIDITNQGTGPSGGGSTNCFLNGRASSFTITLNGQILFNGKAIKSPDCCTSTLLTPFLGSGSYTFVNGSCYRNYSPPTQECPTGGNVTCVDSTGFNIWDNTYTAENGNSLSITNPTLYTNLQTLINNSGSFAVYFDTGFLIDQVCCDSLNYTFVNGVCSCESSVVNETKNSFCFSTLDDFINMAEDNFAFFNNNFTNIGPSLGLSNSDTTFIGQNLLSTNTTYRTNARTLLSNALSANGGIYLNVGSATGNLTLPTQAECNRISGSFWDGSNCKCNQSSGEPPTSNVCNLTDVKVINTLDNNTPIQIAVPKDYDPVINNTLLSEECCLKLKNENNLPWFWSSPYCFTNVSAAACLPVTFTLNETPIELQPCDGNIEIYMWVYVKTPENAVSLPPAEEPPNDIPATPDDTGVDVVDNGDDVIVIVDEPLIDPPINEPPINEPPIGPPINPPVTPTTPTGTGNEEPGGVGGDDNYLPGDGSSIIFGEQPRPSRSENCEI